MYLEAQTIGIRRLVDGDARTISLRRLIGQLEQHRAQFTREVYVNRHLAGAARRQPLDAQDRQFHTSMANHAFDQFSESGASLSRAVLSHHRDELDQVTRSVVRFVDERVAHLATSPEDEPPSYDEFHHALKVLGEMLQRYRLLIDQVTLAWTTPAIQSDWKGPFRQPLL
jgi:hypothetical protein